MTTTRCIYCGSAVDPAKGEGDYVIPSAFGKFKDQFLFRRICRNCNSAIGRAEEQLIRCAPESFLKRLAAPDAGRHRRRGQSAVGSGQKPPPRITIEHPDHEELVARAPGDPKNVVPVEQLALLDTEGRPVHVRLFPTMTADGLRKRLAAIKCALQDKRYLHCVQHNQAHYLSLFRAVWPNVKYDPLPTTGIGLHPVKSSVRFFVGEEYWRAIAKIGFHYYLVNSGRGMRGDEECFNAIRRFIMEGGDREKFFSKPAKFRMPFGMQTDHGVWVSRNWMHVLAFEETLRQATVSVSLFLGPEFVPEARQMHLGSYDGRIAVAKTSFAHAYVYDPAAEVTNYDGHVEVVSTTRIR